MRQQHHLLNTKVKKLKIDNKNESQRKELMINEIFYSIQGEGRNSGTAMSFIRVSGCNLNCEFCDTKYALDNGQRMTVHEIMNSIYLHESKSVCITGGEPTLYNLFYLTSVLHNKGYYIAIETNGKEAIPIHTLPYLDWITISPKSRIFSQRFGHELKLVDTNLDGGDLRYFEQFDFIYFYLQPLSNTKESITHCIQLIKENPKWRLSIQMHKVVNVR